MRPSLKNGNVASQDDCDVNGSWYGDAIVTWSCATFSLTFSRLLADLTWYKSQFLRRNSKFYREKYHQKLSKNEHQLT